MNDLERFMSYVEADPVGDCLLWTGGTTSKGYGGFWAGGKWWAAHRWIFCEKFGYLPEAVLHKCDTPPCVNWERCLKPGTKGENNTDRANKGRNDDRRGMRNPACRLTDDDVSEIRREYAKGALTQQVLADAYGVTRGHIGYLVNGKRGAFGHHRKLTAPAAHDIPPA